MGNLCAREALEDPDLVVIRQQNRWNNGAIDSFPDHRVTSEVDRVREKAIYVAHLAAKAAIIAADWPNSVLEGCGDRLSR